MLRRVADALFLAFILVLVGAMASVLFRVPGFVTVFALILATIVSAGLVVELTRRSLARAVTASARAKDTAREALDNEVPDLASV